MSSTGMARGKLRKAGRTMVRMGMVSNRFDG